MSNKSKGFIIILLVIIVGIIGFGIYYIFDLQTQIKKLDNQLSEEIEALDDQISLISDGNNTGIVRTWYSTLLNTIDVNSTFEPIDQLNTTIEVNSGEWVYISFASNAKLDPVDTLRHALHFYFAIDGDLEAPGFVYEESLGNASEDDVEWIPVSFYTIFKDLEPGSYIISIHVAVAYNTCPAQIGGTTSYMGSSLLIQTLNH